MKGRIERTLIVLWYAVYVIAMIYGYITIAMAIGSPAWFDAIPSWALLTGIACAVWIWVEFTA